MISALDKVEIIPGKNSDTRIKPLPLTNKHGRYIAATTERILSASLEEWPLNIKCNRYKFVTVSLPKWSRNSRFTSETAATATWIQN
jgi:hypothetical protein